MREPEPVHTLHLLPALLDRLLEVLATLADEEWQRPTACPDWTVHDLAAHLLDSDLGNLSRERDGYDASLIRATGWDDLVARLNEHNDRWVQALQGLSPTVLCDLLGRYGEQIWEYHASLDPDELSPGPSWAGVGHAPRWLSIARDYTERWHHQQQIREAVGRPLLLEPQFFAPVLAVFMHGAPRAYAGVEAPAGTTVRIVLAGDSGGEWGITREHHGWTLAAGSDATPQAKITLGEQDAWRLFTRGLSREAARAAATVEGDQRLAEPFFDTVSIIA